MNLSFISIRIFLQAVIITMVLHPNKITAQSFLKNNFPNNSKIAFRLHLDNHLQNNLKYNTFQYKINQLALDEKDPDELSTTSRIAAQIGVGVASGLIGGIAGALVGSVFNQNCETCHPNIPAGSFYGGAVGWILGTTLGIDYVGKTHSIQSNVFITLGGTIIGAVCGIKLSNWKNKGIPSLVCPSICGTIAFNLTAKRKK